MIVEEQIDRVRLLLGDTDTVDPAYPTAQVLNAINDANLKVAEDTLCLQTFTDEVTVDYADPSLPATDSRREGRYGLATDFLSLKDVEIFQSGLKYPLERRRFDDFKNDTMVVTGGRPTRFKMELGSVTTTSEIPGDIWLYPLPNVDPMMVDDVPTNSAAITLRISYFQKPTPLTEASLTEVSELPESFHLTACFYAAMLLAMKDADWKRGDRLAGLYADAIHKNEVMTQRSDRSGPMGPKPAYAPSKHWLRRRR